MSTGLRVYGPGGEVYLDVHDATSRYLTSFKSSTSDGSIVIPGLSAGRPWYLAYRDPCSSATQYGVPVFSVSGTTLSWVFGSIPSDNRAACNVWVGVY